MVITSTYQSEQLIPSNSVYRIVSLPSLSMSTMLSRISLPSSRPRLPPVNFLDPTQTPGNFTDSADEATAMQPSSAVLDHHVSPSRACRCRLVSFGPPGYAMASKARISLAHGIATTWRHSGQEKIAMWYECSNAHTGSEALTGDDSATQVPRPVSIYSSTWTRRCSATDVLTFYLDTECRRPPLSVTHS